MDIDRKVRVAGYLIAYFSTVLTLFCGAAVCVAWAEGDGVFAVALAIIFPGPAAMTYVAWSDIRDKT